MWLYVVKGCYSINKQMHKVRYNYNNVLRRQLQHVSGLIGPPSGSAQLHERIIVELSINTTVELHTGDDENDKELF